MKKKVPNRGSSDGDNNATFLDNFAREKKKEGKCIWSMLPER